MSKKLYVGNLAYETTDATLAELFGTIGEVTSASVITDRMSGRSKGFAFVEMAEDGAAERAISELDGRLLDSRPIKVAEARPREPRENRWGGGDRDRDRDRDRGDRGGRGRY
ncbi:MAG: RNA-binding protein [Chloroflexi bacterium]|nr:RNA-binding protein [Chloroflexota bacterium]MBU1748070.1 RNA-binding protein [Chloroflexota bacterium]